MMKKILSYSVDSGKTYMENTIGAVIDDFKALKDHKTYINYVSLFDDNYFQSKAHFVNYCMKIIRERFEDIITDNKQILRDLYKIHNESIINPEVYYFNDLNLPHLYFSYNLNKAKSKSQFNKLIINVLRSIDSMNGDLDGRYYSVLRGEYHTTTIEKIGDKSLNVDWENVGALLTENVLKIIQNKPGIYKLYNSKKELIYIGMSHNLVKRVISSIREKGAIYVSFIVCKTLADASIIEPYLISINRPILNTQFLSNDRPTFEIQLPEETEIFETGVEQKYIEWSEKRYFKD